MQQPMLNPRNLAEYLFGFVRRQTVGCGPFYMGRDDEGRDCWTDGPVVWIGGPGCGKTTGYVIPSVWGTVTQGIALEILDPQGRMTSVLGRDTGVAEALSRWLMADNLTPFVGDEFSAVLATMAAETRGRLVGAVMSRRRLGIALLSLADCADDLADAVLRHATIVAVGMDSRLGIAATADRTVGPDRAMVSLPPAREGIARQWNALRIIAPVTAGARPAYRLPNGRRLRINVSEAPHARLVEKPPSKASDLFAHCAIKPDGDKHGPSGLGEVLQERQAS